MLRKCVLCRTAPTASSPCRAEAARTCCRTSPTSGRDESVFCASGVLSSEIVSEYVLRELVTGLRLSADRNSRKEPIVYGDLHEEEELRVPIGGEHHDAIRESFYISISNSREIEE